MTQAGSVVTRLARRLLFESSDGVNQELAVFSEQSGQEIDLLLPDDVVGSQVTVEVAEKSGRARYPRALVYCERVNNSLREKFRVFSGEVRIVVEVRVSGEHEDALASVSHAYIDAITQVLHRRRGRWAEGVHYPGTYEIVFGPLKRGGAGYVQATLLRLDVQVNY